MLIKDGKLVGHQYQRYEGGKNIVFTFALHQKQINIIEYLLFKIERFIIFDKNFIF